MGGSKIERTLRAFAGVKTLAQYRAALRLAGSLDAIDQLALVDSIIEARARAYGAV